MVRISTRIARGGFSVGLSAPIPSRAVVHYFVAGPGGRQGSGMLTLERAGEEFVAVDFPVLAVGITDIEIEEAPATRAPRSAGEEAAVPAAAVTAILSSILLAGGISGHALAAVPDPAAGWRNHPIDAPAAAADTTAPKGVFIASA